MFEAGEAVLIIDNSLLAFAVPGDLLELVDSLHSPSYLQAGTILLHNLQKPPGTVPDDQ